MDPDRFRRTAPKWNCFFQAEDGRRDTSVTGVQTCALPISVRNRIRYTVASADHFQRRMKRLLTRIFALCWPGILCRYTSAPRQPSVRVAMLAERVSKLMFTLVSRPGR